MHPTRHREYLPRRSIDEALKAQSTEEIRLLTLNYFEDPQVSWWSSTTTTTTTGEYSFGGHFALHPEGWEGTRFLQIPNSCLLPTSCELSHYFMITNPGKVDGKKNRRTNNNHLEGNGNTLKNRSNIICGRKCAQRIWRVFRSPFCASWVTYLMELNVASCN